MHPAQAEIIADSISPEGVRLTTFQLRYWRPIHSELMTHRVFSRNAGSSRARPSLAIAEQVINDPWGPLQWGTNKPGMQAGEELQGLDKDYAIGTWKDAAYAAGHRAKMMLACNIHKQVVNRLLEPFTYIDVVLTSTDFANWFALRNHPDAQPEIQDLAQAMLKAYKDSEPVLLQPGEWHLPYITEADWEAALQYVKAQAESEIPNVHEAQLEIVRKISVARCARVSYKAFDGNVAPIEKDLELCHQLLVSEPLHASPAEHQATPDFIVGDIAIPGTQTKEDPFGVCVPLWSRSDLHGNFRGWIQYRKTLPNEFIEN